MLSLGKLRENSVLVGYCRTSTTEQIAGLEEQIEQLRATRCTKILSEQISSVVKRDQLEAALEFVREGDCLIVTRLIAKVLPAR